MCLTSHHGTMAAARVRDRWSLNGNSVVVTGGTKGIGRACCEEMIALGANLLFCSRNQVRMARSGRGLIAVVLVCGWCWCSIMLSAYGPPTHFVPAVLF